MWRRGPETGIDAADTMDTWDEAKLNEVVTQNGRKQKNTTDVGVCSGGY